MDFFRLPREDFVRENCFPGDTMKVLDRWQHFLTEDAGPYIEIQAGLGKTQYGCLPMAPHTAWEWLEQYGPVQLPQTTSSQDNCQYIEQHVSSEELERLLQTSASFAHQKAAVVSSGSTRRNA